VVSVTLPCDIEPIFSEIEINLALRSLMYSYLQALCLLANRTARRSNPPFACWPLRLVQRSFSETLTKALGPSSLREILWVTSYSALFQSQRKLDTI
jgi:hypothetical protein